jgi:hypothetical protein
MGCMFWLVMGFVLLLLLPLPSNLYAEQRISDAQTEAYKLAEELGYTPERLLRSAVHVANVDIITGEATCSVMLYFVTPLDLRTFEARLLKAQPGTSRFVDIVEYQDDIYSLLPLTVNGASVDAWGGSDRIQGIPAMFWDLPGGRSMDASLVSLYLTHQVPATLAFGERPIRGNIAVIDWTAGRHPVWAVC